MKRTRSRPRKAGGEGWSLDTGVDVGPAGEESLAPRQGPPLARLRLEKRRGKPVTVASMEGLDGESQRSLVKELKARCGSGGTLKDGEVELQGDHRETLRRVLAEKGMRVKG